MTSQKDFSKVSPATEDSVDWSGRVGGQVEKAWVCKWGAALGSQPVPCALTSGMAWLALLLGRQNGQVLVALHHGDNEEATGQQEGGPEEGEKKGLGPVEALE